MELHKMQPIPYLDTVNFQSYLTDIATGQGTIFEIKETEHIKAKTLKETKHI
jgi:hypothetical protein